MLLNRLFRQAIVTIEQFVPAVVSDFHSHTRGADDVGEKNGRQDPILAFSLASIRSCSSCCASFQIFLVTGRP
jgi:hypothetical protein